MPIRIGNAFLDDSFLLGAGLNLLGASTDPYANPFAAALSGGLQFQDSQRRSEEEARLRRAAEEEERARRALEERRERRAEAQFRLQQLQVEEGLDSAARLEQQQAEDREALLGFLERQRMPEEGPPLPPRMQREENAAFLAMDPRERSATIQGMLGFSEPVDDRPHVRTVGSETQVIGPQGDLLARYPATRPPTAPAAAPDPYDQALREAQLYKIRFDTEVRALAERDRTPENIAKLSARIRREVGGIGGGGPVDLQPARSHSSASLDEILALVEARAPRRKREEMKRKLREAHSRGFALPMLYERTLQELGISL